MEKIYIAGPITGHDDYLTKFEDAENFLKTLGHKDIVNPAMICLHLNPETTTWDQYMSISETLLEMCDTIFMLEGWQYSVGASIEHASARANKLKVIYETDYVHELKKDDPVTNALEWKEFKLCSVRDDDNENYDSSDPYMDVVYKP